MQFLWYNRCKIDNWMVLAMEHRYENGKIIVRGKFYEKAVYHVSNKCMSAIFDGRGAVCGYALANSQSLMSAGMVAYYRGGEAVEVYEDKTVEMLGRCQVTKVDLGDAKLLVKQFLDESVNGVFMSFAFDGKDAGDSLDVTFGQLPPAGEFTLSENELSYEGVVFGGGCRP